MTVSGSLNASLLLIGSAAFTSKGVLSFANGHLTDYKTRLA